MTLDLIGRLKRATAVFSAVCFAALFAFPAAAEDGGEPNFTVHVSVPPHIVFLGDSITAGYGLDGYSPDDLSLCPSYANILVGQFGEELPPQAGFSAQNFAKDGTTSTGLLKKLRSGELDLALREADAVVISIGGNDLLGTFLSIMDPDNSFGETIDKMLSLSEDLDEKLRAFEENLPQIAAELTERSKAEIFIQTLYNPMEDTAISVINDMSAEKIGELNRIITDCSEAGTLYTVADVAAGFAGRAEELTNIASYDIHPNAAGHAEIADIVRPIVESADYTYRDAEAAMQYELDEIQRKLRKRSVITAVCSGSAALIVGAAGAVLINRRRKNVG